MMIPVRCFSCGQVVADRWEQFSKRTGEGKEDPQKVLDDLEVKRYCCRRMIIGHTDLIDELIEYNKK